MSETSVPAGDSEFGKLSFASGSVRGVRAFRVWSPSDVVHNPGTATAGLLSGMYFRQTWVGGVNEALCKRRQSLWTEYGEPSPGDAPEPGHLGGCDCGFYGFYDGSNDYYGSTFHGTNVITGVIEGWGGVVVGTRGFRCTRARIVALLRVKLPFDLMVDWDAYGVPVFDSFNAMVAEFPSDDGGAREAFGVGG